MGFVEDRGFFYKNAEGDNSLVTVARDLLHRDRQTYAMLIGKEPPSEVFELSLAYSYPGALAVSLDLI